jgi:hypothetical protein
MTFKKVKGAYRPHYCIECSREAVKKSRASKKSKIARQEANRKYQEKNKPIEEF